ncbi:MAG: amino acid ABC transporter substrate-binding protein [Deltaproteobacteria bacterium]|nr:MAG: amino acid ABC transporter substrate-binding protein [Deltaproteobacteria bacterium]
MQKKISIAILAIATVFLFAFSGPVGADTVKIGVIENLTGSMASLDQPSLNGVKLALKEINDAGGVLGKKVEIIVRDGKSDPATLATVVEEILGKGVSALTGLSDTTMVLAAAPAAQRMGVSFVSSGATSPSLPDEVGDCLFLEPFGDNVQAAAAAEYAYNDLGAKSVWVLYDKAMDYTYLLQRYFCDRFGGLGGAIISKATYQTGDTDFRAQITSLKSKKTLPDILFISSGPDEIGTIVKQVRDMGIKIPIVGGDGYDTPLLAKVAGPAAATDIYFTTHVALDSKGTKAFVENYNKMFGHPPENGFAALGYDAFKLIVNAVKNANSADPKAVKTALAATQGFKGVTGTINYPKGIRVPQKSVTIIKVDGGKFIFEKEVMPSEIPAP